MKKDMNVSALDLGAYIIKKCNNDKFFITNLQLQKILYIVQKYFIANHKEPILNDNFEAWKFGPVVPAVYYHYSSYGSFEIMDDIQDKTNERISKHAEEIDKIIESRRTLKPWELVHEVHIEDGAWERAIKNNNNTITSKDIEREIIRSQKNILIASNNNGKKKELKAILGEGYRVFTLNEVNINHETIEDKNTLKENSLKKAREIKEIIGPDWMVLADDSGLFINALRGEPGVYTARYAAMESKKNVGFLKKMASNISHIFKQNNPLDHNDLMNMRVVLDKMKNQRDRRASFITTLCFIGFDNKEHFFEGTLNINIALEPRGDNGFGYDPILEYKGKTLAEMTLEEKNIISHRGMAIAKLKNFLNNE